MFFVYVFYQLMNDSVSQNKKYIIIYHTNASTVYYCERILIGLF